MAFVTGYLVLVLSGLSCCQEIVPTQPVYIPAKEQCDANYYFPESIAWNLTSLEEYIVTSKTNEQPENSIVVMNEGKPMHVKFRKVLCKSEQTNTKYYCSLLQEESKKKVKYLPSAVDFNSHYTFYHNITISRAITPPSKIKIACNAKINKNATWIFISMTNNKTAVEENKLAESEKSPKDGYEIFSVAFEAVESRSGVYICIYLDSRETSCVASPLYAEYIEITEGTEPPLPIPKGEQETSEDPMDTTNTITALSIVIVVTILLLTAIAVFFTAKIRKQKKDLNNRQSNFQLGKINPDLPLEEQLDLLPYDPQWEFPKGRLKLGKVIGHGSFGRVIKADAIGLDNKVPCTTVAIKMSKDKDNESQYKSLMAELKIMSHLGKHVNILNLLGAVTKNIHKGELMVMVEYCCNGNLRSYLMKNRKRFINQIDPETGKFNPDILWKNKIESIDDNTGRSAYNKPPTPDTIQSSFSYRSAEQLIEANIETSGSTSVGINITGGDASAFTVRSNESGYHSTGKAADYSFDGKEANQNSEIITTSNLICYCFQCAQGMEYLASKKLIHRDLAARNILLAERNVIKISDFGLSKDVYKDPKYVRTTDGPLPVKWMAIESVKDGVFTTKSDVWSFGVLMWEVFALGENPYPEFETYEQLFKRLQMGYRLEKPKYSSDDVYRVMLDCWQINPEDRPDFSFLGKLLGDMLEASSKQYYLNLNDPYPLLNANLQSVEDLSADADDNLDMPSNNVDTFGKLQETNVDDGSTLISDSEVKESIFDLPDTTKDKNEPMDIPVSETADPETDGIYNETASAEIGLSLQCVETDFETSRKSQKQQHILKICWQEYV